MLNKFFTLPILLLTVTTVFAGEADTTNIKQYNLSEVVVVSSKETQQLEEAPLSASTFSGRKLTVEGIKFSKDLTAKVPNLFMPDYGSKINSPIYIRGIGSKVNAPSVGLYVDNMPYFEKCTYDIDLADIERLEVLRGPQGTLYGRNTMGGIINVYTKSPFDYQGTRLNLTGGTYGNFSGKISNYSKLSEKVGLTVSGNYLHRDGFFTNDYRNEKADKMDDAGGKIKLSYKPTQSLLVELSANLTYSNQYGYPYALADSSTFKADKIVYNEKSGYKQMVSTNGLMLRYSMKNMLLTSMTSYQWFDDQQKIDQDFLQDSIYFVVQKMRQNMVSEEITLRSNSTSNYQWVTGVFGFYQAIRKEVDMDYRRQKYTSDKDYVNDTKGFAAYHQSTYNNLLVKGLSAGVGIRFDFESSKQDYKPYKIDASGTKALEPYNSELDFTQFVPKFNLMYLLNKGSRIYASAAKGYKTGGFNDSFQKEKDRTFDPEYSWNYELGYKFNLLNNAVKGDFTLFYIDWENQQISYLDPEYNPPVPILKNAGKSESKGFEADLGIYLVRNLDIDFQYGYTYATFTDYKKDAKTDYSGNYIPYIPKNTVSLTANYTIPCRRFLDRIVVMGQYNGIGSLYWEEANKYKQDFYSLMNAQVTFHKGRQSVSLWGRNLSNAYYNAYLFNMGKNNFCQQGKPMTLGIDLTIYL